MRRGRAAATLLALLLVAPLASRAAEGEIGPGSYCPLPREGEKPSCLEPAVAEYGEFFRAVDSGSIDAAELARVEGAVASGAASPQGYLALSSIAYGYYRLSQQAARTPEVDPAIAARLERWNALLGQAYDASQSDAWRTAVRAAALDLHRNAPSVPTCRDAQGAEVTCDSTDALMREIDAKAGEVGFRGGLERLLERILGEEDS